MSLQVVSSVADQPPFHISEGRIGDVNRERGPIRLTDYKPPTKRWEISGVLMKPIWVWPLWEPPSRRRLRRSTRTKLDGVQYVDNDRSQHKDHIQTQAPQQDSRHGR